MSQNQSRFSAPPPRDVMAFLFSDGRSPLAGVEVSLVALGKQPGVKSDLDLEHTFPLGVLPESGELALNDPVLASTFDAISELVKAKLEASGRTGYRRWEGIPGRRNPAGYTIHPDMRTDRFYPVVPLNIEIERDKSISNSAPQRVDFAPGTVITSRDRFAVGSLDGNPFGDTCQYLEFLAQSYGVLNLTNWMPVAGRELHVQNSRISEAFPLRNAFAALGTLFRSPRPRNSAEVNKLAASKNQIARKVYQELAREIAIPEDPDLRTGYQTALHRIAGLACSELQAPFVTTTGPLARLTRAAVKGLGVDLAGPAIVFPFDDYAHLGTLVFSAGLIPHGYLWGSVSTQFDAGTRGAVFVDARPMPN